MLWGRGETEGEREEKRLERARGKNIKKTVLRMYCNLILLRLLKITTQDTLRRSEILAIMLPRIHYALGWVVPSISQQSQR
jgi:hypothetical protein